MKHRVTVIPGDGVGPELIDFTCQVLEASGVAFQWDVLEAGPGTVRNRNEPSPDDMLESIRRNRVALKGPLMSGGKGRSPNGALRRELDLFACVRPISLLPGVLSRYDATEINLVVIRENLEDLHMGIELAPGESDTTNLIEQLNAKYAKRIQRDAGIGIKPISAGESRRIVDFAFQYARTHGRQKVTAVHMADIMKHTDGVFMQAARERARANPDIPYDERRADNLCMHLAMRPEEYDVLVLPNLYGDLVSDLCAGLSGGIGVAAGYHLGDEYAVFEASHGPAMKYVGQDRVNPLGLILSGALLLDHLGEGSAARRVRNAVASVVQKGRVTYDMKATRDDPSAAGTREVAMAVINTLRMPSPS